MKDYFFKKDAKTLIKVIGQLKNTQQTPQVRRLVVLHEEALNVVEQMDRKNPVGLRQARILLQGLHKAIQDELQPVQPSIN